MIETSRNPALKEQHICKSGAIEYWNATSAAVQVFERPRDSVWWRSDACSGHWAWLAPQGEYALEIRFCPYCGEDLWAIRLPQEVVVKE